MSSYEGLKPSPDAQLMLKVVADSTNTNVHGDIFAGWLLNQMDSAATLMSTTVSNGRCTTVAMAGVEFHSPVNVGDLVTFYARLEETGRSSMVIVVEVFSSQLGNNMTAKVTEGRFTSVALNNDGSIRQLL